MAESPKPARRFVPQLVESSSTSSSSQNSTTTPASKSRRFVPEPVETSSRSSRKPAADNTSNAASTTASPGNGDPHIEIPKARRRFAPEPVETTHRSSRKEVQVGGAAGDGQPNLLSHERLSPSEDTSKRPARRKFSPQLIETASRSRKAGDTGPAMLPGDKTNISPGDLPKPPRTRPSPTPLPPSNTPNTSNLQIPQTKPAPARQSSIKPHYTTRANTRQHSYRVPSLPSIDSSESEDSDTPSLDASRQTEDSDTSDEAYKDATRLRESVDERFSGYLLALAAKQAEKQLREQEAAAFPNVDYHEPVAHYMNRSDSDELVAEPTVNAKGRAERARRDSGDERAALKEMRKHGEKVYHQNQAKKKTGQFNVEFDDTQPFKLDVWQKAGGQFGGPQAGPKQLIGGRQQDPGLKQMRKAASPPMLGGDIDFPRCPSPDHARFDVTQGADYLRKNVCYLSEQSEAMDTKGMWSKPQQTRKPASPDPKQGGWLASTSKKHSPSKSPQRKPAGGLWGGHCNAEENQQMHQITTGLVTPLATPRNEPEDPFAALYKPGGIASNKNSYTNLASMGNGPAPPRPGSPKVAAHARDTSQNTGKAPPSPPYTRNSPPNTFLQPPASDLDEHLVLETRIATEFSDAFVTQVFNYLSLGYPSLAWKFDDELSRISKVPIGELREDDKLAEARGYVRLGNDEVDTVEMGVEEGMCKRWRALRRYVHEWGRQMLKQEMKTGVGTFGGDPHRAWGLPARRGSWGLQPIRRSALRALATPASTFQSSSTSTRSFATLLQSSQPISCTARLTRPQRSSLLISHLRRTYATNDSEPGTTTESVKAAANETTDAAKDTAESAKQTAESATEKTKEAGESYAQEAGSSTRNSASDIVDSASNSAQTASQAARDTASSTLQSAREGVARAGETVADAARSGSGAGIGAASSAQTSPIRSAPVGDREKPNAVASTNLYVGNLYFEVSAQRLQKEFEKFGELSSCKVISDARGLSKGFGYVDFANASAAEEARSRLDGQILEGRRLVVQFAIKPRQINNRQNPDDPNSFVNPPSKTLFIGNLSYEMTDKDLNDLFKEVRNVLDVRVAIDRRTGQPRGFAHADFIDVKSAEAGAEFLREREFYGRRLRVDFSTAAGGR